MLLNGTPDQKKKLIREYLTGESESSSGDEFEKEMEAELSSTIRSMEGTWAPSAAGNDQASSCETTSLWRGSPDTRVFVLQQTQEAAAAALDFRSPGCTMRCILTLTQRRRTNQVSLNMCLCY